MKVVELLYPKKNPRRPAIRTPFEALEDLGKTYDHVVMVVGDDRVDQFQSRMTPYTEEWGIESFDVVSAGTRDPDADGVEGVSASKARQFVTDGDYEGFATTLSPKLSDGAKQDIYSKMRSSLGLEEDADNKNADEYRAMGLRGHFAYSGSG